MGERAKKKKQTKKKQKGIKFLVQVVADKRLTSTQADIMAKLKKKKRKIEINKKGIEKKRDCGLDDIQGRY